MTTCVKVTACCSEDIVVAVLVTGAEPIILDDGATTEVVVYDDKAVTVMEFDKNKGMLAVFEFEMGQSVQLKGSSERGKIIGLAEYEAETPSYYVRYLNGNGVMVCNWQSGDFIEAIDTTDE